MAFAAACPACLPWFYFAAIDPTIGAATIAAVGSIVTVLLNAALLRRHERHVDQRFDDRRLVATHTEGGVWISDEERRELEDRRAEPETRKERGRRRRQRRN